MHDFNFFRSYHKPKGRGLTYKQGTILACSLSVFLVVSLYGFNFYRIHQLETDMKRMDDFVKAPENVKKYQHYIQTKDRLALLTSYYGVANKVNQLIDANSKVDYEMIATICGAMPEDITLQMAKINSQTIDFQGGTDDRLAVAEFEHNLLQTGYFQEVFVQNIDQSVDINAITDPLIKTVNTNVPKYLFNINCKLKEVTP